MCSQQDVLRGHGGIHEGENFVVELVDQAQYEHEEGVSNSMLSVIMDNGESYFAAYKSQVDEMLQDINKDAEGDLDLYGEVVEYVSSNLDYLKSLLP